MVYMSVVLLLATNLYIDLQMQSKLNQLRIYTHVWPAYTQGRLLFTVPIKDLNLILGYGTLWLKPVLCQDGEVT